MLLFKVVYINLSHIVSKQYTSLYSVGQEGTIL